MSITSKIREKSLLIFIVVGVAMLLFIVDPTQVMNWLGQSSAQDSIGEFEGEAISSSEWGFDRMTQNANDQQKDQIFRQMIQDTIYNRELNRIGFTDPTNNEVTANVYGTDGVPVHPILKRQDFQFFKDANGQFSEDSLIPHLSIINNNPQLKQFWALQVEPAIKKDINRQKYIAMVKQGLYVSSFEVKNELAKAYKKADIKFAFKGYSSVADSLINITDEDLKAYYEENKHKDEWKQNAEQREFDYIEIEVLPSGDDKLKALEKVEMLKADFMATDNDSLFVSRYAETAVYNNRFKKSSEFPKLLDSLMQASDSGDLVGPYEDNGAFNLSKIRGTKLEPEATVRHILFGFNGDTSDENDAKLKAKADSVLRVIKSKNNFEEMVQEFSTDPGSKANGGKYEWFPKGQMVTEFEDFSFDKPIGSMGVVKTQFGYHLMEVLDRREAKTFQVATIDAQISPQQVTQDEYYDKGLEVYDLCKSKEFQEAIGELGYASKTERINLSSPRIGNPNLKNSSEILRWVFNADANEVSEPFSLGDRVVIAQVTKIEEEGIMSFDAAKTRLEAKVKKIKKAEYLKGLVEGVSSVEGGATKFNTDVKEHIGLSYDKTSIAGVPGNENKTIGEIFGMTEGTTQVIEGETGVFVMEVSNKSDENGEVQQTDIDTKWPQMLSAQKSRANSGVYSALNKQAEVKDYRKRLELKNRN